MTILQRSRLYGPAWRRAWEACWHRVGGAIQPRPGRPCALPGSGLPTPDQVEQVAVRYARAEFRAVTEADLRRAIRALACGRDVRSADALSHGQLQRVVAAMRVLADPDDLNSIIAWDRGTSPTRRALVGRIEASGLPDLVVSEIARSIYGTGAWRTLPDSSLAPLSRLVWKRAQARVP